MQHNFYFNMNDESKEDTNLRTKSLVICSGGLDSVAMALCHKNDNLTLLTFNYGQKAKKESEVVEWLGHRLYAKYINADISSLKWIFGDQNQLTNDNVNVEETYKPSIVVPLRNGVFLQLALTYAYANEYDKVILGSHLDDCHIEGDDYAFPDCTSEFFMAMDRAAQLGTLRSQKRVEVESASLRGWHKTNLIQKAYEIDKEALFKSWSCYYGNEKQCGVCDSCRNRRKAFEDAGIKDETEYLKI